MSTFTDWNGPQGSGIKTSNILDLVKAYQDVLEKFNGYQTKLTFDRTPTAGSGNPVESGGVKSALSELESKLSSYLTTASASGTYQTKLTFDEAPVAGSSNPVKSGGVKSALDKKVDSDTLASTLKPYLLTDKLSEQAVITTIQSSIVSIKSTLDGYGSKFNTAQLTASDFVEACIHADKELRFNEQEFSAQVGGSHGVGVYYILGMLDSKGPGNAYIRYANGKPFEAYVSFVVSDDSAAINVLSNSQFKGTRFLLVRGTDTKTNSNVYLAVQSEEWIHNFSSTDGHGMFQSIGFYASGINFAAHGTKHWVAPNAGTTFIVDCAGDTGFGTSGDIKVNGSIYAGEDIHVGGSQHVDGSINVSGTATIGDVVTDRITDTDGRNVAESKDGILRIGDDKYDRMFFDKRPFMSVRKNGEEDSSSVPFVNENDLELFSVPAGGIIHWGKYYTEERPLLDDDGKPVVNMHGEPNPLQEDGEEAVETVYVLDEIPNGWHACDGSEFDPGEFPELFRLYPDCRLPVADFSIIRMSDNIDLTYDDAVDVDAELSHKHLHDLIVQEAELREHYDNELRADMEQGDAVLKKELEERMDKGDGALQKALDVEAGLRRGTDDTLDAKITNARNALTLEETTRKDADKALQKKLDDEATAREAADKLLQENIDNEAVVRETTDNMLADVIEVKEGDSEAEDARLNARIDSVKGMVLKRETESKKRDAELEARIEALEPSSPEFNPEDTPFPDNKIPLPGSDSEEEEEE